MGVFEMKMRLKDGKTKVLTLSYDDGTVHDIKLIEIMNRYGLKGTFNVNTGSYFPEDAVRKEFGGRLKASEEKKVYLDFGHEVAVHGFTHPFLDKMDTAEIIYEIVEDRKSLESNYRQIVRGMAYPFGVYNKKVIEVLEKCHISYARTCSSTHSFNFPDNWLMLNPTCHHNDDKLDELIKRFVEIPHKYNNSEMFYLWGHSVEFEKYNNWYIIEKFAEYAGNHEHIWYATNIEIYDYVKAYESLQTSFDKKIIHNPTSIDVWFDVKGDVYCVRGGETIYL